MMHTYDVILRATIELGGQFQAHTRDEAIDQATRELRAQGEMSAVEVERAVMLDEDEFTGAEDLPPEAYDPAPAPPRE